MTEQAIVKKGNGTNLLGFGRREEIRDLAERLQATMPGGRKLSGGEATSLAQLSMAHGLDPFNGEAWLIPGSGLMVGIKGLRKTARRMADQEDGIFWTDFQRVEPKKYDVPEGSVVYECHLRDTRTVQAWSTSISAMTTAAVPYAEAIKALGPSPVVIGVGVASPDERSKMDINQRARKRAEADAIKQRYDVDFAEFSPEEPNVIDVEFTPREPRSEAQIMSDLGFDPEEDDEPEQPDPIPTEQDQEFTPEQVYQMIVDAGLSENIHAAKKVLDYCKTGYDTPEKAVAWFHLYRGWKDMGGTTEQAAKRANAGDVPK